MAQDTKECWSFNNEDYNYDSLAELMDSHGYEMSPGHTVWRGIAERPPISSLIDVEGVIENIGERAYEICGEYAEDYPDVSAEHQAKLKALLEAWLAECPAPTFYTVKDAQAYILRPEDFSAEQLAENALEDDPTPF